MEFLKILLIGMLGGYLGSPSKVHISKDSEDLSEMDRRIINSINQESGKTFQEKRMNHTRRICGKPPLRKLP